MEIPFNINNFKSIYPMFRILCQDEVVPTKNQIVTKYWSNSLSKVSLPYPCKNGPTCKFGMLCKFKHSSSELDAFRKKAVGKQMQIFDNMFTERSNKAKQLVKDLGLQNEMQLLDFVRYLLKELSISSLKYLEAEPSSYGVLTIEDLLEDGYVTMTSLKEKVISYKATL